MSVVDNRLDKGAGDFASIAQQPEPRTGFFANVGAGWRGAKAGPASTRSHQNAYEASYYDQIVAALNARGLTTTDRLAVNPNAWGYRGPKDIPVNQNGIGFVPSSPRAFVNPYTGRFPLYREQNPIRQGFVGGDPEEMAAIWATVQRERQRDPSFLKDFPDALAVTAKALEERTRIVQRSADTYRRAGTVGTIGNFLGGVFAAPLEPESYIGGMAIGPGKTVARTIIKRAAQEGAVNAGAGIIALPGIHADSDQMGLKRTLGDDVRDVAQQAAFGAVFAGVKEAAGPAAKRTGAALQRVVEAALENVPEPIRNAAVAASIRAGTVRDRAMIHEVRRNLAPYTAEDRSTPTERDALNVLDRDADTREESPLHPDADSHHEDRLDAVLASLGMERAPPPIPTPAPVQTPTVRTPQGRAPANLVSAINHAEGTGRNPRSTATGVGQFLNSTWLDVYKRHFGAGGLTDAQILARRSETELGHRMTEIYAQENAAALRKAGLEDSPGNISLAHFLGSGGAKALLRAEGDTPVARLLDARVISSNPEVLRGKTAAQVIAWAHKRIGAATDLPPARADAVPEWDYADDVVPESLPPVEHRLFRPDELTTDAPLMQYKSGGDAAGVTERLAGVTEWNPLLSGKVIVWAAEDGRHIIVDGHQRLGLAQRLYESDPNIGLDGVVLREADGVTAQQARVIGALKNIAEGTGSVVDAARVLRDAPDGGNMLPPRAANVRAARGLAGLSHEAFGAVLNDVIDPEIASVIGRVAVDNPSSHMALISMLREAGVVSQGQAETVIRQARADGFGSAREEQLGMFGEMPQQSLYGPAARILEAAKRQLKAEKRSFKVLTEDAARIERAGNVLDREANQARVLDSDTAIAILDATAHSAGPVRTALLDAARASLGGDRDAVRGFLAAIDGIDLQAAARGVEPGGRDGGLSVDAGHAIDPEEEAPLLSGGDGPSLFDDAVASERAGEAFSEPAGDGSQAQADSIEHDILVADADQHTYRVDEDGDERSASDILATADRELSAIDAVEACMKPGGMNDA
jgi:hypothetical protein